MAAEPKLRAMLVTNIALLREIGGEGSESAAENRKPNPVSPRRGPTIIPLAPSLLTGSSSLPGSADGPSVDPLSRILLPYLALLRAGFCLPSVLPRTRCALTAPFHPCLPCGVSGVFSVPLSFGSPRPAVNRRTALRSSDFPPHLSARRSSGS